MHRACLQTYFKVTNNAGTGHFCIKRRNQAGRIAVHGFFQYNPEFKMYSPFAVFELIVLNPLLELEEPREPRSSMEEEGVP